MVQVIRCEIAGEKNDSLQEYAFALCVAHEIQLLETANGLEVQGVESRVANFIEQFNLEAGMRERDHARHNHPFRLYNNKTIYTFLTWIEQQISNGIEPIISKDNDGNIATCRHIEHLIRTTNDAHHQMINLFCGAWLSQNIATNSGLVFGEVESIQVDSGVVLNAIRELNRVRNLLTERRVWKLAILNPDQEYTFDLHNSGLKTLTPAAFLVSDYLLDFICHIVEGNDIENGTLVWQSHGYPNTQFSLKAEPGATI